MDPVEAEQLRKREQAKAYLEKHACGPSALEMGVRGSFLQEGGIGGTDNTLAEQRRRMAAGTADLGTVEASFSSVPGPSTPAPPPTEEDKPLPKGWSIVHDPSGASYFRHDATGCATWECPNGKPARGERKADPDALPVSWKVLQKPGSKRPYYWHTRTGEVTLRHPAKHRKSDPEESESTEPAGERERALSSAAGAAPAPSAPRDAPARSAEPAAGVRDRGAGGRAASANASTKASVGKGSFWKQSSRGGRGGGGRRGRRPPRKAFGGGVDLGIDPPVRARNFHRREAPALTPVGASAQAGSHGERGRPLGRRA